MSAIHRMRIETFEHIQKFLKKKGKVTKAEFIHDLLINYSYSRTTAKRYIEDAVEKKLAKNNGDFLEYIFDKEEEK